ncbi:MAG TPA: lipid-A-disaccharide synthase N-terminal domain-containing protein [Methyloceanibacter sp.]|nr:lipid-A-disaccharide synthase N-terminal domain-containing protein [Methyloceanibacter sp.]
MHWSDVVRWWVVTPTKELIWIGVGLLAQFMFSMRFLVQWIATERARASIIPETFWYFSFFGGLLLLAYACYRVDPVFIIGQAAGLVIYSRNLYFIWLGKQELSRVRAI